MIWGGIGRLSMLTLSPKHWIAATTTKSLRITKGQIRQCRRTFSSSPNDSKGFGNGKKSLAEFYAFDGVPPSSFTLVYKAKLGHYFVTSQTILWLSLTACGVTLLLSLWESYKYPHDEQLVAEKKATAKKIAEASRAVTTALVEDTSSVEVKVEPSRDDEVVLLKPALADLVEKDLGTFSVFVLCLLGITLSCTKLLRSVPVRVYIGKKGHCIGAYYGSIIPGRIVQQEFVAGTLTRYDGKRVSGETSEDGSVFRTANGSVIVLFEQFFRTPADFNFILNVGKDGRQSYDPSNPKELTSEDLLSQDIISAFDTDDPRKRRNPKVKK